MIVFLNLCDVETFSEQEKQKPSKKGKSAETGERRNSVNVDRHGEFYDKH